MPNPNPMYDVRPFSLLAARAVPGMTSPRKIALFMENLIMDYYLERHDFNTAIETAHWTAANAGTAPTDFAYNAQRGGALRGATGTTANNVIALYKAQTYFDAADNPFMLVRFKTPAAVSSFAFEIGFTDPKTSEVAVSVTDIDTPAIANGVTDGVVLAMDTAQTLVTPALLGVGTSTTVAKSNITDKAGAVFTPTVSKWWEVLIGARAGQGYCSIWENQVHIGQFSVASGPDAGVLMRPSLLFKTLNTTTKQIDIDYIVAGSERNAT